MAGRADGPRRAPWHLPRLLVALTCLTLLPAARGTPFTYHDHDAVVAELNDLAARFPTLTRLSTAQDDYGLPGDGPRGEYRHHILRVTNESRGLNKAELLIVAGQHGDEAVGVEVALATARLLLEGYGVNPWLTALVDRREIYFVPMANPEGYVLGQRASPGGEGAEDMNRDHVHGRSCQRWCQDREALSTVGARALWELTRRHQFRVVLDFHAGMELISHPWGSRIHADEAESPDHRAARALGRLMSDFAGPWNGVYPVGTSGELLGAVVGALDDAAYAASWEPQRSDPRFPTRGSRALAYTMEISNQKRPPAAMLGGDAQILTPGAHEDGYVPKNVRAALAAIDASEPFVEWINRADVPPVVCAGAPIEVHWRVRGCISIDETRVRWGRGADPRLRFEGQSVAQSDPRAGACLEPAREFREHVRLLEPGVHALVPVARVDGDLLLQSEPSPAVPPQSFLVRSRNAEGLLFVNDTDGNEINTVVGREYWSAAPLPVVVVDGPLLAGDVCGTWQQAAFARPLKAPSR